MITTEIDKRFEEIRNTVWSLAGSKALVFRKMMTYAKVIVPLENVKQIYAKNLYNRDDEVLREFYYFTENDVYIIKADNTDINVQVVKNQKVKDIQLTIIDGHEDKVRLNIEFSNGVKMEFNSLNDANENWINSYRDFIMSIYKIYA
ncbi:DUF3908 family protein [Bacillus arachidis]|uniref:DUF3908 family protein n=1 Tax=Bacillus arachidis TaxID=2819290 RepID=A0ABS3P4U9_9BACI|nr:DUF3908 family protein [Bacillus arachidis]MBO1628206.1 DUF3908 family protein [Bacillus arachidis]